MYEDSFNKSHNSARYVKIPLMSERVSEFQPIPVTLVGGFLGAGKTSLVNHILRHTRLKWGVIVNEFGTLGIDGGLIEQICDDVTELANGCVCCSARDDLLQALLKLARSTERPERVLIELSGLADPVPTLQTLLLPEVRRLFALEQFVAVVDARHLLTTLRDNPEGALQLAYATRVLINKQDLVDADLAQQVRQVVQQLNPLAEIRHTCQAEVDEAWLISVGAFDLHTPLDPQHQTIHTAGVRSFVLKATQPLNIMRWQTFLQEDILARPSEVLRVKGYLSLQDLSQQVLFQAVRDVFSAESQTQPSTGVSELVVIGTGLDQAGYQAKFAQCMVDTVHLGE